MAGTGLGKKTEEGGGFRTPSASNLDCENDESALARPKKFQVYLIGALLRAPDVVEGLPGKYRLCDGAAGRGQSEERQV